MPEPTVTSKNLPKPPVAVPPPVAQGAAQVPDEEPIVAKPLATPDFINLKKKNPNIELRWVNRVAGTVSGQPGQRVDQMLATGFAFATPHDVEVPASMLNNGKITHGDLVLMKHDRRTYQGALKYNEERARKQGSRDNTLRTGQAKMQEAMKETSAPLDLRKKIQVFVPGEAEANALVGNPNT